MALSKPFSHLPLRGQCRHCSEFNQSAPASRLILSADAVRTPQVVIFIIQIYLIKKGDSTKLRISTSSDILLLQNHQNSFFSDKAPVSIGIFLRLSAVLVTTERGRPQGI